MENSTLGSRGKAKAIKLTFSYEGDEIRLVEQRIMDKPTQPSAPMVRQEKGKKERQTQSGFWIELHGRRGRPLYRLIMSNPIRFSAEIPDEEGGFTNVTLPKPSGLFFAVVPNLEEAQRVVVFSSPLGPEAKPGPAEPVARFALRDRKEK